MRILAVLFCLLLPAMAAAEKKPPFVIVLVPGLKADDLIRSELQPLQSLVSGSGWGWMNSRTARVTDPAFVGQDGRPYVEAACVTINAGSRAAALHAPGGFSGTFAELVEINANLDHQVPLGALGDMLRRAGLKTAVLGRADDSQRQDFGRLIAMDSAGNVELSLAEPFARDPDAPYGIRTNVSLFSKPHSADFQVWVFGDVWRAEQYAHLSSPAMARKHRSDALSRLGHLLDIAAPLAQAGKSAFLLLSPQSAPSTPTVDRLAPILRFGYGVDDPGILTSASTRTDGLVTNTDILPTVAAYFGLSPPAGFIGTPLQMRAATAERRSAPAWARQYSVWLKRSQMQSALGGLPALHFVFVLAGICCILAFKIHGKQIAGRCVPAIGATLLTIPLGQLVLPTFGLAGFWANALLLSLVTLAVTAAALFRQQSSESIARIICSALLILLAIDLLTGQSLLRNAWMSYSVMDGARYYGIGNEYSGAAMGALGALLLLDTHRIPPTWGAAAFVIAASLVGLPVLGADAGALAAFLLAAAAAAAGSMGGRRGLLVFAAGICFSLILIAVIALLDSGGSAQSHIGRSVSGGGITGIALRKAALNAYLLLHSKWSLCLIAAAAGIRILHLSGAHRVVTPALITGTIALLLLNDSGVVAAANTLLVWFAVLLMRESNPARSQAHLP